MSQARTALNAGGSLSEAARAIDIVKRAALIVVGTAAVIAGAIGVFIPVLPTTPLLLLAAACYAASSERFYKWLISNRLFGPTLKNYREGRGMSLRVKIGSLSMMWTMLGLSIFFFVTWLPLKLILLGIGATVSIHLMTIRTVSE